MVILEARQFVQLLLAYEYCGGIRVLSVCFSAKYCLKGGDVESYDVIGTTGAASNMCILERRSRINIRLESVKARVCGGPN